MKPTLLAGLAAVILSLLTIDARAFTISVGPFVASTNAPFIVPIEVTGAVDLQSFAFDIAYDPTAYVINTACDAFSDTYCDFSTGPVTLGTFYTAAATYPPLFNPGFILLDGSGSQTGQLVGVNGAWQDPEPAPSGVGVLAYIEFVAVPGGTQVSSIDVVNASGSFATISEPASALLVAGGFGLIGLGLRRGRRSVAAKRAP